MAQGGLRCPRFRVFYKSQRNTPQTTSMLNSQATSAAIYKQLFTDVEWDAISSAMEDYSDYGDCEANIADSIQAKIAKIYELTSD